MSDEKQTDSHESPAIKEFNTILAKVPKSATTLFPPLVDIVKFVGKVVRRQDALEARLDKLESAKG